MSNQNFTFVERPLKLLEVGQNQNKDDDSMSVDLSASESDDEINDPDRSCLSVKSGTAKAAE